MSEIIIPGGKQKTRFGNENKNHSNPYSKKPKKQKKMKREKTNYIIEPSKMNLVEMNRKYNKEQLKFNKKNHNRNKELHKLEKVRRNVKEYLKQQKTLNEPVYSFQPQILKKSKKIMSAREPHIDRTYNWLNNKQQKIQNQTMIFEEEKQNQEFQNSLPIKNNGRNKVFAVSKVKLFIEHPKNFNLSKSFEYERNPELRKVKNNVVKQVFKKTALTNISYLDDTFVDGEKGKNLNNVLGNDGTMGGFRKALKSEIHQ